MNLLKASWLMVGLYAFGGLGFAQSVTEADIYSASERWMGKSRQFKTAQSAFSKPAGQIRQIHKKQLSGVSIPFYVVQLEPEGFMIMNSDKRLPPVLAFSANGTFNLDESSSNGLVFLLKGAMQRAEQKMFSLSKAGMLRPEAILLPEQDISTQWAQLLDAPSSSVFAMTLSGQTNGPFLQTTWNQNNHYNELCPADPAAPYSYDGRVPVGCVAVVAAQLMKYYQWPYRGTGSNSYTDGYGSNTGVHSADFSDPYDWASMKNSYNHSSVEPTSAVAAVSELMYEMGVSVAMDYERTGSASSPTDLNWAFSEWFFYQRGVENFTLQTITQQVYSAMQASQPAIITLPGHAVVADGYTEEAGSEYFHINYGWGGVNDSWYLLDDIVGDPAVSCITGVYPALIPLNKTVHGSTQMTANVQLEWALPAVRTVDAHSIAVLNRQLKTTVFADPATNFAYFKITSASDFVDWRITNGGYSGNCFFKPPGGYSGYVYNLTSLEKFVPVGATNLSFRLKARLSSDAFRVMISADNGASWSNRYSLTGFYNPSLTWQRVVVDLSPYVGSNVLIRFEYVAGGYYSSGGVWLDEIQFSGGRWYDWATVQTVTNIVSGTTFLPSMTNGAHTFAFQASTNGIVWEPRSPAFDVVVNASPIYSDIDSDGLPDSWETLYFGGATNANASVDADGDGFSNRDEYISGLNPTNGLSFFKVDGLDMPVTTNGGFIVRWTAVTGRVYSVDGATNLLNTFQPLGSNIVWPQASYTDTLHNAKSHHYYRINVQLAP